MQQVQRPALASALFAGVALASAGLIAVNPAIPALSSIHRAPVQLVDWASVISAAEANLQTLTSETQTAGSDLMSAVDTQFSGYGDLITSSLSKGATAMESSLSGGFYGNDDGYVFGLFEGPLTDPNNGVTETGSTLQEIASQLEQGNLFGAYSYFDTWSLESTQHILEPLLNPILTVTSHGVTTDALPGEMLQTLTNLVNEFGTWKDLQNLAEGVLSPQISVAFGLTGDLDTIATELASGNISGALTGLGNIPSDLVGDLLNGYIQVNPIDGSDEPFTGLLNNGSLLDDVLVTWPTMFASALDA